MYKTGWIVVALALGGCAGMREQRVSDQALARATAADRQEIRAQQRRVSVAESNAAAARAGLDDALKFQDLAQRNVDAAKASLDAARSGRSLGQQARNVELIRAASSNEAVARRKLAAARAMDSYATQLTALRQARLDEAEAEANLARANVEATRLAVAERHGQPSDKAAAIRTRQDQAAERLADARLRVQEQATQAQALRDLWMERRQTAERASAVPMEAPPPPRELPMPQSR